MAEVLEGVIYGGGSVLGSLAAVKAGLAVFGFSSIGPVAGTCAAAAQAAAGNVVAGSAFAIAQSAAMGGLATVAAPAIGIGAVVGALIFVLK